MVNFTRADSSRLTGQMYDLLVIGGGINGVAIARDAAIRGLSVSLIERGDLAVGTSSWNSRLIHGGLRYLEHGEIPLVYESLHDRERLLRIAPHLVVPLPFIVPLYKHNHLPGWMFRIGMVLYDALSLKKSLPRHRHLNRKALNTEFPGLDKRTLRGAVHYYDSQVVFPERLVLETAAAAAAAGADIATYVEATGLVREHELVTGADVRDIVSGEKFEIRAKTVVNAAGPWVDELGQQAGITRQIGGTSGTHLVVDDFPGAPDSCVYFEARADNRAILVIPWNGRYLIGTTDNHFEGDPSGVRATDDEVDYLLSETNQLIPTAGLTREDVLLTYTGVRPLPYRPGVKAGAIPRSHLILTHERAPGLVTIVGGKLTPHLSLARETVDKVAKLQKRTLPASRTGSTPLPNAPNATHWPNSARDLPWDPETSERIRAVYGAAAAKIAKLHDSDESLRDVFGTGRAAITAAEVAYAIREECAVTLTDIIHRRSMVGLEPTLGTDVERDTAALAARLLNWDTDRTRHELAAHREYIQRLQGGLTTTRALPAS